MAQSVQSLPTLSAVLFKDENAWVAQCVEIDIAAQGNDLIEVKQNLVATIVAEHQYCGSHGQDMHQAIGPAPDRFEKLFKATSNREFVDDLIPNGVPMRLELATV